MASVIASVTEEIKLQHARRCRTEHHARQLPDDVLAMRRLQSAKDDYAAWAATGLCKVVFVLRGGVTERAPHEAGAKTKGQRWPLPWLACLL